MKKRMIDLEKKEGEGRKKIMKGEGRWRGRRMKRKIRDVKIKIKKGEEGWGSEKEKGE